MRLREWLDAQVDVVAARQDGARDLQERQQALQSAVSNATIAAMALDARLEAIEAKLGIGPIDFRP